MELNLSNRTSLQIAFYLISATNAPNIAECSMLKKYPPSRAKIVAKSRQDQVAVITGTQMTQSLSDKCQGE